MILRIAYSAAGILLLTCAVFARQPSTGDNRDYVRFSGDDKRGTLETSIVTMKNDAGVQVELVGAVHIADKSYYAQLRELFKTYEVLLFELVDGQALKGGTKPRKETPHESPDVTGESPAETERSTPRSSGKPGAKSDIAFNILRGMMTGLGSYLRLEYQTDGIDYHASNFVHADVSMAEFQRLQAERGESFLTLFQKALDAQLGGAGPKAEDPKPSHLLLALLGDPSGIKIAMARMLGEVEQHGEVLGFGADSVIVGERNRVALEVFDKEVAAGRKNLGIFYGAAHLPDLEERLASRGYKRTAERWIRAWDIKPRVDELTK